jgi:hypothetical protein
MNKNAVHPRRTRALLYIAALTLLLLTLFGAGLGANNFDQSSRTYKALSTMSGGALLSLLIFTIPFILYAIKYWRLTYKPVTLPPADTQSHSVVIKFTQRILPRAIGFFFEGKGTLSWVNSDKVLRLVEGNGDREQTVFEVPFAQIEKFTVTFNMVDITVNGKRYTCTPSSALITASAAVGAARGSQLATIALGANAFQKAGVPELAERLRQAGVEVIYTDIRRSVEVGFVASFIVLFTGALFVSAFLVK